MAGTRARREAERAFASQHADALLVDGARRQRATETDAAQGRPPQLASAGPARRLRDRLCRALHACRRRARGLERRLAAPLRAARDAGSRAPRAAAWHAALQLVSRAGVVSEAELLEFRSAVETLGGALGARSRAPEMRAALDAARELDKTCADADIQVALHVIGQAARAAVQTKQPFQVGAARDGVTLMLDVAAHAGPRPQLRGDGAHRPRAARVARRAAGGRQRQRARRPRARRDRRASSRRCAARSPSHGIEPGSPLALRLFS